MNAIYRTSDSNSDDGGGRAVFSVELGFFDSVAKVHKADPAKLVDNFQLNIKPMAAGDHHDHAGCRMIIKQLREEC